VSLERIQKKEREKERKERQKEQSFTSVELVSTNGLPTNDWVGNKSCFRFLSEVQEQLPASKHNDAIDNQ